MNLRLFGTGVFISLPAIALCVAGTLFYFYGVPRLESTQKAAASRTYRLAAEELFANPDDATFHGLRQKGWRQTGKVGKATRRRKQVPWGHVTENGRELVWIGAEDFVSGVYVEIPDQMDIGRIARIVIPIVLSLVILLTFSCLRYFIRYATERDDFMAAVAHDLTTPLVSMRRFIGRDDDEARALVEEMFRLVKNLTDFLAFKGRANRPKMETFNVRGVFNESYQLFREDYRALLNGADVAVEGEEEVLVAADPKWTAQIFWNLLSNGLKYAAPFGNVRVRFVKEARGVLVCFEDEGPGLSPRERRRIFRRYYRAKSSRKNGKVGFGIGLSTARALARAMDGDLRVAANRPRGCVFTLKLKGAV